MTKACRLLIGFLCVIGTAKAQLSPRYVDKVDFDIYNSKYLFIKANMAGKDIKLFFDTGASTSLLDKAASKKVNLVANGTQTVHGAGGANVYEAITNQQLKISHTSFNRVDMIVSDLTRIKESFGRSFDGVIGHTILSRYKTEMNFDDQKIYLYGFSTPLDLSGYEEIKFDFYNGIQIPQFNIWIEVGGKKFEGRIFFDSGAGLSLLINTPYNKTYAVDKKALKSIETTSENLSKRSTSKEFLAGKLKIGSFEFEDFPISVANDEQGVSAYKGYLGLLGIEIIKRFNVVLDYSKKSIYLKPNNLHSTPFVQNLTGFKLKKTGNEIIISSISQKSPFYIAGLREGDA